MVHKRKQIEDLQTVLEVINPIESKKVLGGEWYDGYYTDGGTLNNVNVAAWTGNGSSYGYGGDYQLASGMYDYGTGWNNNPDDVSGNGGGGDSWGYVPTFPNHICKQESFGATCATIALSYVANYFGATGLTSSDFAEMSGKNYQAMNAGLGGLTPTDIKTILSQVFVSTIIDGSAASIESNLQSGNPILATIDYGNGNYHEVVMTEFDGYAGTVSFMDSLSGTKQVVNISSVTFTSDLYAVSGIQNNTYVDKYKNDKNDISYCTICGH